MPFRNKITTNLSKLFITLCLISGWVLAPLSSQAFFSLSNLREKILNLEQISRIVQSCSLIQRHYYDEQLVQPDKIFKEGFYSLSKAIPEMLVEFPPGTENHFIISIANKKKIFTYEKPADLFDILSPIAGAFRFIQENYQGEITPDKQEYAFISGMLSTLDPHSNFLTPEVFEELKTQTQGEYGGLGIVVGMKDDELTVISPLEGTPAMRAGLKAEDKITEIDHIPTINMLLSDAVSKLRGKVNTKVVLTIARKNKERKDVTLIREQISIISVKSKKIKQGSQNFGVVSIRSFQEETYNELVKAIATMSKPRPLDGLVLDFRNNPGGLLDQSIEIADLFLEQGDILYTVGADDNYKDLIRSRKSSSDILGIPIIVLVNHGSASASEIVAGALKNNNRALVMGTQTFGKGSVQSLLTLRDDSSIKLTIAQYLTPGLVSIQAVGIIPDIELHPVKTLQDEYDLIDDKIYGESDLDKHLENQKYTQASKPFFKLRYLEKEKPDEEKSEYVIAIDETKDYGLNLALKMLATVKNHQRPQMIKQTQKLLEKEADLQDQQVVSALSKQKIDWHKGHASKAVPLNIRFTSSFTNQKGQRVKHLKAGQEITWKIKATNQSTSDVYRLVGVVKSENLLVNQKEFVFGKLSRGLSREASIKIKVPEETLDFEENVTINFLSQSSSAIKPITIATHFREKANPKLSYRYQLFENSQYGSKGNGNGRLNAGEKVALKIDIKNDSAHPADDVIVNIKSESGDGILLREGRSLVGQLAAKSEKQVVLAFEIDPTFKDREIELTLTAFDKITKHGLRDTLKFNLSQTAQAPAQPLPGKLQKTPLIHVNQKKVHTNRESLLLGGLIQDDQSVKDIAIFSSGKKVYYLSNPDDQKRQKMSFSTHIPLEEGINYITIQARDDRELISLKNLTILGKPKTQLAQNETS